MKENDSTNPDENGREENENDGLTTSGPSLNAGALEGMSPEAARDYILHQATALKRHQLDLQKADEDLILWTRRLQLAKEKAMFELVIQTQQRVDDLTAKRQTIERDTWLIEQELDMLKQNLKRVQGFQPSVDAQQLAQQIEDMVGKEKLDGEHVVRQIQEQQVDDELAALKAKLKKNTP